MLSRSARANAGTLPLMAQRKQTLWLAALGDKFRPSITWLGCKGHLNERKFVNGAISILLSD